ncbi:hypothetical protein CBR_g18587 [Chara braunii]|uniref:Uncharacterized protein n=1 Tax=Chara braunii TaxID=69332 RepID=A0A388JT70_CHABU|nr:hypothetical protein CBR_g18587 [Chara braunii]|eukprot:GBG60991.1 hypothetical protein CBR_g18587 [Chara braunii]
MALKRLTNYKGMIERWVVRLQEYDFHIVHRKTEKHVAGLGRGDHGHVDRVVGSTGGKDRNLERYRSPIPHLQQHAGDPLPGAPSLCAAPMDCHRLALFNLLSDLRSFWKFAIDHALSFWIWELSVPILDEDKWNEWWDAYVELGFCLVGVVFHWAKPAPDAEGVEVQDDEVELLIAQAWGTDTEGELLRILFGKVEEGHHDAITHELLVFLVQLVDDLPLDILSRCDEKLETDVLTRTLAPHLLWSTCTELDGDNCFYPSPSLYLEIDVADLTLWDRFIRRGNAQGVGDGDDKEEEEAEEEESGTDRDDPEYICSEEEEEATGEGSGSGEPSGRPRRSKEEEEAEAQRRREKAKGKRPVEKSERPPPHPLLDDPSLNPEPPHEESEGNGAAAEGSGSRRRRRSESSAPPSPPSRATLHLRRNAGNRALSLVVIPSSP